MGNFNEAAIRRRFIENGFWADRSTKHGTIWTDGISRIMSSRGASQTPRTEKKRLLDIKRAVAKREALKPKEESAVQMEQNRDPKRIIVSNPGMPKPEPLKAPLLAGLASLKTPEKSKSDYFQAYDPAEKDKLCLRIMELFEAGHTHGGITKILGMEGFKSMKGEPHKQGAISSWIHQLGLKRNKPRTPDPVHAVKAPAPVTPLPAPKPRPEPIPEAARCSRPHVSDDMLAILKDPTISDAKKVKLVLTYLE